MDDQFKDGFERLLADMDDAPTWEQVSTQTAHGTRRQSRWHRPLVVAAAFVFTLVAIGSVVFLVGRDGSPVAAEIVDYVKIEWSEELVLRCEGMDIVDNGGFSSATIEVWGPNAAGLLLVEVTAPDGTIDHRVVELSPESVAVHRVWSSPSPETIEDASFATLYRNAECFTEVGNSGSSYAMSSWPILPVSFQYGAFIAYPTQWPNGDPRDFLADLVAGAVARDEVWRGIPVVVYTSTDTEMDSYPEFSAIQTSASEVWVDLDAGRFERQIFDNNNEILGGNTTTIEVVEREVLPASSVSFSTEDLVLVYDEAAFITEGNTDDIVTTTTLPADSLMAQYAYLNWVNQLGLNQDDLNEWTKRLELMCAVAYRPATVSTTMADLADQFIEMDAQLTVRADGGLPTVEKATETLWITVGDPRSCPQRVEDPTVVIRTIDPSRLDEIKEIQAQLSLVRSELDSFLETTRQLDEMIAEHESILASTDLPENEQNIRESLLEYGLQMKDELLRAAQQAMALQTDLLARKSELQGLEVSEPPVITLGGAQIIYSRTGNIRLKGRVDQPVQVFALEQELDVHTDTSGQSTFDGEIFLTEGEHAIWIIASNAAKVVSTVSITVIVDPNLEVQFAYIAGLSEATSGTWSVEADYAQWFIGEEARAAAIRDSVIPEDGELDGGFYIRNSNPRLRTLDVAPGTIVTLQACWPDAGPCIIEEGVDVEVLSSLLDHPEPVEMQLGWSWYGTAKSPFWFTLKDGVVVQIVEQYLP